MVGVYGEGGVGENACCILVQFVFVSSALVDIICRRSQITVRREKASEVRKSQLYKNGGETARSEHLHRAPGPRA